jgi:hypothetical protein
VRRRHDNGTLNVVVFVHDHHRSGDCAIEGHRLEGGPVIVDDDPLLFYHERELDDLGALISRLFVRMHEGRRDERDVLARQIEII